MFGIEIHFFEVLRPPHDPGGAIARIGVQGVEHLRLLVDSRNHSLERILVCGQSEQERIIAYQACWNMGGKYRGCVIHSEFLKIYAAKSWRMCHSDVREPDMACRPESARQRFKQVKDSCRSDPRGRRAAHHPPLIGVSRRMASQPAVDGKGGTGDETGLVRE